MDRGAKAPPPVSRQVHMARELGMNPAKLGKIDNHKQEPWKLPLPQFIEDLYFKRFGKTSPEAVLSIEERCRREAAKKEERRIARQRAVDSATTREAPRGSQDAITNTATLGYGKLVSALVPFQSKSTRSHG